MSAWRARLRILPRAFPLVIRELGRAILSSLRGEPGRLEAALEYVKETSTPGDPDSVLVALDRFARERRMLINIGDKKGLILDDVVKRTGSNSLILEIGCYAGYSAIRMARHLDPTGKITSLEANETSVEVARKMIRLAGLEDRIEILHGSSSELIATLEGSFDIVFLDHWKALYEPDLKLIERSGLIRRGSIVIADNVGPIFGVESYLDYVRNGGKYKSSYISGHAEYWETIEDGVEISVFQG